MASPRELPLFPLGTVLFPGMVLPLHIFEDRYKTMIRHCLTTNQGFGVVLIQEGSEVGGGRSSIFDIGTMAQITQVDELDDGRMNIASLGVRRFRILDIYEDREPYLVGLVQDYPFDESDQAGIRRHAGALFPLLKKYLGYIAEISDTKLDIGQIPNEASTLAYLTAIILRSSMREKQLLLSLESLAEVLETERDLLAEEAKVLRLLTHLAPSWRTEEMPFSPN
jgi:hypothetical protein